MLVLGGGRRWQSGHFSKQQSHSDSCLWLFQPTSSRLSHISSIKAEQLFRERAFVLSSGDYRISHRSQQSVLKCSLKKNTCLWHHLPFKRVSLPSSFPWKTLPQPLNWVQGQNDSKVHSPARTITQLSHQALNWEKDPSQTCQNACKLFGSTAGRKQRVPLLCSAERAGRQKAALSICRKDLQK